MHSQANHTSRSRQATLAFSFSLAALAALSPAALAQGPEAGLSETPLGYAPPLFGVSATLPGGDLIVFDGLNVERRDASGVLVTTYGTFGSSVFASFVAVDPNGQFAIVGESSNGELRRVDLVAETLTPLATAAFNYDGVVDGAGTLWLSAGNGVFGSNLLSSVDTTTGAITTEVTVPGFSGPVGLAAAAGDSQTAQRRCEDEPGRGSRAAVKITPRFVPLHASPIPSATTSRRRSSVTCPGYWLGKFSSIRVSPQSSRMTSVAFSEAI